jgi:nuclease S1
MILGGEISLASISNWADHIALLRPETVHWHFVNIPYDANAYDPQRDCPQTPRGDCIINAIARWKAVVADRAAAKQKRLEALMFLVHLVGDIHQPLHCIDRNDAGGSQLPVIFFDRPMSLHAVWDFAILDRYTFDWGDYASQIERDEFAGKDLKALQAGEPVDWALESHKLAVEVAYQLPEDFKLGDAYYQAGLSVVSRQLGLAGIRLARILNDIFARPRRH